MLCPSHVPLSFACTLGPLQTRVIADEMISLTDADNSNACPWHTSGTSPGTGPDDGFSGAFNLAYLNPTLVEATAFDRRRVERFPVKANSGTQTAKR